MNTYPSAGAAQCKLLLMDNPKLIDSAGHDMDWFGIAYVKGHGAKDKGQYDRITEIFWSYWCSSHNKKKHIQKA